MAQSKDDYIRWALILVGLYAFYKIFIEDSKKSTLSLVGHGTEEDEEEEQRVMAEQPDAKKPAPNQRKPVLDNQGSRALHRAIIGGKGTVTEAHRWRECQGGYRGLDASSGVGRSTNYHPGAK